MASNYKIPAAPISVEIEVRKSRFICHLAHAKSAEQAKQFIAMISEQYATATHNCWAFQTDAPGSTSSVGCSDDGEPHGTAGRPILNVLCHSDVGQVVAVVTRYYGGTKLGTGGLARAYSDSVKMAVGELSTCEQVDWQYATLSLDYSLQAAVEKVFCERGAEIISSQFDDKVALEFRYDLNSAEDLNLKLSDLSQGKLKIPIPLVD